MCGFVGIWDKKGRVTEELLRSAGQQIQHRGPDYQGVYLDNEIGFVHQRLSIIDLDPRSSQPMHSKDKRYVLVFNGEIYNYKDLRRELIDEGEVFETESDTEVLLALFQKYQEKCLQKIEGMFAFCVYDALKKTWFFARDRLGIKPLYYSIKDGVAVVTSDIKSLQAISFHPKRINRDGIWQYLYYGYFPQPTSVFKDVFKLLPGHYASIDNQHQVSISKYWEVESLGVLPSKNYENEFLELFQQGVEKRLISDVEVAAFSSGGLDSSSIITQIQQKHLKTFTIGFEHQSNKLDLLRSEQFAKERGIEQYTKILPVICLSECDDFFAKLDEPLSEASIIPLYFNYKQAREKGIKVVLGGDGADEILGGYDYFGLLENYQKYSAVPKPILRSLRALSNAVLSDFTSTSKPGKFRDIVIDKTIGLYLQESSSTAHEYIISQRNEFNLKQLNLSDISLLRDKLMTEVYGDKEVDLSLILKSEQHTALVNKHLAKVDKASMANSVEARVPFLDHKLVEFCAHLPAMYKRNKSILKQSMSKHLPAEIINDKKRGFNLPIKQWTLEYIIEGDKIDSALLDELGVINVKKTDSLKNDMLKGKKDTSRTIWSLYVLSQWLKHNQYQVS